MKLLILSVLVASSLCLTLQPNQARFEPSKLYVYDYESQVLTGLPTFSKQYAGIKVVCQVRLTFGSPPTMQLANIQLYQLNKEIEGQENLPPMAQLPNSQFTELPTEDQVLIRQKLTQPIRFTYVESKVTSIQVCEKEETNWSIDIKRSILSLLQVKLQPDENDYKVTEKLEYNKLTDQQITTFDILESATDGICYSSLNVYKDQSTANKYKVVKARDHLRCIKRNNVDKVVYPQRQSNCDCRNNMRTKPETCRCSPVSTYKNNTEQSYNIVLTDYELTSEDERKFVIQRATQSVEYRLEAPQAHHQFVLTTSNQTLWLKEVKNRPSPLPTCSFKQVSEPWRFRILRQGEGKPMMTSTQLNQQVEKALDELVTITEQPERFDDHLTVFFQLIRMLRLCGPAQLEQFFNLAKQSEPQPQHDKKWQLYIDALSQVNTTDADLLILRKMNTGELTSLDAVNVMITWTASKVPTRPILDNMNDYLLDTLEKDLERKNVYYHTMLCFSAMVRRYIHSEEIMIDQCVLPWDKKNHQDNINNCRKYEKAVEGRLSTAKSVEDKIMLLKAVANIGSVATIPILQQLLADNQPQAVRVHAIWAFKNMGFQNKLKTVQSLAPIMLNHHADAELRIAAFVMVMRCNPTATLLELQRYLNNERNLEFKTYVVKYMKNMLQEQQSECPTCNMRAREVLKSVRAFRLSQKTEEFQVKYGLKSSDSNGDMIRVSTIGSRGTTMPRASSIQQFTGHAGKWNHLWEVGYRAQGVQSLIEKLTQQSPTSSIFRQSARDLRHNIKRGPQSSSEEKPSITFYARVLGQQISFYHLDENKMVSMLLAGSRNGSLAIPLKFCKTAIITPRQSEMLQPSGAILVSSVSHIVVVDIDGLLKVELGAGRLPVFSFESTKPIRAEFKTFSAHYVDSGFAYTGIISDVMTRSYVKTAHLKAKYDMQQNYLSINATDSSPSRNTLVKVDMNAMSGTSYVPARLPHYASITKNIFKELAVDESEKKEFETEITAFKSVELEAKIQGCVNMPELYSFVRGRLVLLPTYLSIYKQAISMRVQPTVGSQRTFSLNALSKYLTQQSGQKSTESSQEQPGPVRSILGFLWNNEQKTSSSESSEESQGSFEFQQSELGSLRQLYSLNLASISRSKVLNMTGQIKNYYEHDYPNMKSVWKAHRPAIPSQESEPQVWESNLTSTINPSNNQLVQLYNIHWGPQSKANLQQILLSVKYTPTYKDNVCEEQNAYGCKDRYGVTYPVWYNNTIHVESINNHVVQTIRDLVEPYLINTAQSVYMYPNKHRDVLSSNSMQFNVIIRPLENKLDYICYDSQLITNFSQVWAPIETQLNNYITEIQYPVGKVVGYSGSNVLPIHLLSGPIHEQKSFCTYGSAQVKTFEGKTLVMPETDCEILLSSESCGSNPSRDFSVSVIPNKDSNSPRIVKVKVEGKSIELIRSSQSGDSWMIVRVDSQPQTLDKQRKLSIKNNSGKIVAEVECNSQDRCELLVPHKQTYINFKNGVVAIEMENSKVPTTCGVCAKNSSLPVESDAQQSKVIIQKRVVPGEQCTVREQISSSGSNCQKNKVHKVMVTTEKSTVQVCVTADQLNSCSQECQQVKRRHVESVASYCVSQSKAYELGVQPKLHGSELVADISHQVLASLQSQGQQRTIRVNVDDQCQ